MSGMGDFCFGERPTLLAGRGGVFQKDPSQGGDTMGEEEAKTSKPIGEIVAFENEPSWLRDNGNGGIKNIQAR